jgi:hypothetical protein
MASVSRESVCILTIDHKHGTDIRAFRSDEALDAALAAWVRQWWPTEVGRWPDQANGMTQAQFDALPDHEAIRVYFDAVDGNESYSTDFIEVEG